MPLPPMPHAFPTRGRLVASLALAAMLSVVLAPVVTLADSANAVLRVSVVVAPSCAISNGAGGFDLSCSAGAERTSRVTLDQAALMIPIGARLPTATSVPSPWPAPRVFVPRPARVRPIVLTINF